MKFNIGDRALCSGIEVTVQRFATHGGYDYVVTSPNGLSWYMREWQLSPYPALKLLAEAAK